MSRRPKRSRAEQRTPTVIQVPPGSEVTVQSDTGGAHGEVVTVAFDVPRAEAAPDRELPGAPFDEQLPALHAEVLAAVEKLAGKLDAGLQAGALPLPAWWPEDASQQATLVEALDSWDLGYNEVGGISWREQLVVVTRGGLKLHWPADRGREISDMHKGRPHVHTGPGRQFPGGYLRRDASRDPKE